jgi:hypothetical protein
MKMRSLITIAGLLLGSLTVSANPLDNCSYEKMLAFAVQNSFITEVYGEKIVHSGGPSSGGLLVADLVSETGYREIQLVRCGADGQMSAEARSIRQGKVVFANELK